MSRKPKQLVHLGAIQVHKEYREFMNLLFFLSLNT